MIARPVLDRKFRVDASLSEFTRALSQEEEKVGIEWTSDECVGGLFAWSVRALRGMGTSVWASAVLPLPMETAFTRFLHEWDVNTEHCTMFPGRCAATIHLSCKDGHRLLTRAGVEKHVAPHVPAGIYHDFDLVLAKPGALPTRRSVLRKLRDAERPQNGMPPVAIVTSSDYTGEDLKFLRDEPNFYLFANGCEATSIAAGLTGNTRMSIKQSADAIKAEIGSTRLVVSLGKNGAMLLNGSVHFSRVAKSVVGKDTTGCGDKLAAVTSREIARGVPEATALDRAVATVSAGLAS